MFENPSRPLILVTNDDGIGAPGILALTDALKDIGNIAVVAPDGPRSGASCGITSVLPISYRLISNDGRVALYSCSGTPVDCVKLACEIILPHRPDVVASGINLGDNASVSVHYSGTMGAVIEGCLKHVPSVGFSLASFDPKADFSPCKVLARQVVEQVLAEGLPQDECLNVNFPARQEIKGLRASRQARGEWVEEYVPAKAPHRDNIYWLTGRYVNLEPEAADTDMAALADGWASVVRTTVNTTARQ